MKGSVFSGNKKVPLGEKETQSILANMQKFIEERESPWSQFMGGINKAYATTYGPATLQNYQQQEDTRNKQLMDYKTQMAQLQSASEQRKLARQSFANTLASGEGSAAGAGATSGASASSGGVDGATMAEVKRLYSIGREDEAEAMYQAAIKMNATNANKSVYDAASNTQTSYKLPDGTIKDMTPNQYREFMTTYNIKPVEIPGSTKTISNVPMSVRNNNPGNLVDTKTGEPTTFKTPEAGKAALDKDLDLKISGNSPAYKARFGEAPVTPANLAEVWAPASAKGNSQASTSNYGASIAKALGIKPTDPIPNTPEAKAKVSQAIAQFEAGAYNQSGSMTAPVQAAPVQAAATGTAMPDPKNYPTKDAYNKAMSVWEDQQKSNIAVQAKGREVEEQEAGKVISAIQGKSKEREQIKMAAKTIQEEAKNNPKAFAYQQQGGPLGVAAALPVAGGAISDVYAAASGDAKSRQRVNTAADLLGVENTKDLFGGLGARIGAQLMNVGRSAKGVGTDISAEDNLKRARFVELGVDKVDEQSAAWQEFKKSGGNAFEFLQSPQNKAIEAKYENILKQEFPSQYENAAKGPKSGDVVKGHKFKGGDPADKKNWEKV